MFQGTTLSMVAGGSYVAADLVPKYSLRLKCKTLPSVAKRKRLDDESDKNSSLSFSFSPLTASDVKAMFSNCGVDLFFRSNRADDGIDHFKNLDFFYNLNNLLKM
jgi:hypothetical protein